MKKFLAVLLAALMMLSVIPMAAFAKVDNNDKVMTDILDGEYEHLNYVKDNKYFKTEIGLYTFLSLYDNAWDNYFTGSVDTDYAKTILLALIDRMEAQYDNETFEQILSVLKGANTVAGLVEKVDGFTELLNLAESSAWTESLGILNDVIKVANFANNVYEEYVEAYAIILSCQAANVYYGDLLQYLVDNCADDNVKKAAKELKKNITATLEESTNDLILALTESAAKEGAEIGVEVALDSYGVTSVIKTVYKTIGSLSDKLFNTSDKYQYMSSLAMLARIEDVLPAYVKEVMKGEDGLASDFALNAIITVRETGEKMLLNLAKVKEDDISVKLTKDTAETNALKKAGAMGAAKLAAYRQLIAAEETYKVSNVFTSAEAKKAAKVFNANGDLIATVKNKKINETTQDGLYISEYNTDTASYVKVIVMFIDGCTVEYEADSSSDSGSTSTGKKKTGLAAFFESIINIFKELFANLFKKK